jgi:hypothetical protein
MPSTGNGEAGDADRTRGRRADGPPDSVGGSGRTPPPARRGRRRRGRDRRPEGRPAGVPRAGCVGVAGVSYIRMRFTTPGTAVRRTFRRCAGSATSTGRAVRAGPSGWTASIRPGQQPAGGRPRSAGVGRRDVGAVLSKRPDPSSPRSPTRSERRRGRLNRRPGGPVPTAGSPARRTRPAGATGSRAGGREQASASDGRDRRPPAVLGSNGTGCAPSGGSTGAVAPCRPPTNRMPLYRFAQSPVGDRGPAATAEWTRTARRTRQFL